MRTRLIIVALISFALGAGADRLVRVTGYDHYIEMQARQIQLQDRLIGELKAELNEINAVLAEGERSP